MKKIKMCTMISEFEKFINKTNIEVLQVDVKVVTQSFEFQDGFCGTIFHREIDK